jgi:hypothetical protein
VLESRSVFTTKTVQGFNSLKWSLGFSAVLWFFFLMYSLVLLSSLPNLPWPKDSPATLMALDTSGLHFNLLHSKGGWDPNSQQGRRKDRQPDKKMKSRGMT